MSTPAEPFTTRRIDDAIVVQIDVDNLLGLMEVNRIGTDLNALVKEHARDTILDVSKVRYSGSAALGLLLSLSKSLQEHGKRLVLTGTHHIDSLLKISRTRAVFEVATDVDAAMKILKKQS
jgi:anti-anti-sigma factor